MGLRELTASLGRESWLMGVLDLNGDENVLKLSKSELKMARKNFEQALKAGQGKKAFNWFMLCLVCCPHEALDLIKKNGLFRSSKYGFRTHVLRLLVDTAINHTAALGLSADWTNYLDTVKAVLRLADEARRKKESIIARLMADASVVLKSLIAAVDLLFLFPHEYDPHADTSEMRFYPKEELSEGLSYLIYLFHEHVGIREHHFDHLDEVGVVENRFTEILVDACIVRRLMAIELRVDAFGFRCTDDGDSVVCDCPDTLLHKAMQHGYIQTELQLAAFHKNPAMSSYVSIADFVKYLYSEVGDKLVTLEPHPIPRFVIRFPEDPRFLSIFNDKRFFMEDVHYFAETAKEQFASFDEMKMFKVGGELTLYDVAKVQRLFYFLRCVMLEKFSSEFTANPTLVVRSLLPVYQEEHLVKVLGLCLTPRKAEDFLRILSWDASSKSVLDLQYQPIVRHNKQYLIPANILGSSNLLRNILQSQKMRLFEDGTINPLHDLLKNALLEHMDQAEQDVNFDYGDHRGDIDVVARHGNRLFFFECKNSLLPCNEYELRTSYDYVLKGAAQLTEIRSAMQSPGFADYLRRKLNWPRPFGDSIVTCIATGNRMFSGLRVDGHAVRSIYELCNILTKAEFAVEQERYCLWGIDGFDITKVIDYIEGDSLHRVYFDLMIEEKHVFRLGPVSAIWKTYRQDALLLQAALRKYLNLRGTAA